MRSIRKIPKEVSVYSGLGCASLEVSYNHLEGQEGGKLFVIFVSVLFFYRLAK
jgi:hypothetical protein